MSQLKQGRLTLRADSAAVTFGIVGSKTQVRVRAEELGEIIAFLMGHSRRNTEQRTGFRVPLIEPMQDDLDSPFRVELYQGRTRYPAHPQNLSLTGILVESPQSSKISVGESLLVHLELGLINITLQGIVRRNPDDQLGIEFPQSRRAEELDPPDELVAIFKLLESSWLKCRVPA